MHNSRKIFIDASVIFAFIDRAHPKHEQAAAYFRFFAQETYQLFVDEQSIIAVYNQMYTEISPSLARDFLRTVSLSNLNIVYPEEADARAALKTLITYQSTELTYPKAMIAVLANKRGITQICTLEYLHPLFGQTTFYLPI